MVARDMWIWPGMELVAYAQEYNENYSVNGAVYVVEGWDEQFVWVRLHEAYRTSIHVECSLDPDEISEEHPPQTSREASDSEDEVPSPPPKRARKTKGSTEEQAAARATKKAADAADGLFKLTYQNASKYLRMQHALVYANIQGRTMRNEHLAILDWHGQGWNIRTLIVAMSRATHSKFVHILHADEERDLLNLYRKRVQDLSA